MPYITFQHIKGKDNILADSLSHLQCLELYEKSPSEKPGQEFGVTIVDVDEIIYEYVQPDDFTPSHPDVVTLISNPNHEEMVTDKHTFQVGDDLYEKNLPKSHIQYTPQQIKHLQMKDPPLTLIINKLQKGTQPQQILPNT